MSKLILSLSLLAIFCSPGLANDGHIPTAAREKGLLRVCPMAAASGDVTYRSNDRVGILLLPFPLTSRAHLVVNGFGSQSTPSCCAPSRAAKGELVVEKTLLWYDQRRLDYISHVA